MERKDGIRTPNYRPRAPYSKRLYSDFSLQSELE